MELGMGGGGGSANKILSSNIMSICLSYLPYLTYF